MTGPVPGGHSPVVTPASLLAAAQAREPGRPLVTFYDDATGERVELSVVTFANWVAKTANLLVDGLGLGPGDSAALLLPAHWQTAAIAVGCWSAGLEVDIPGETGAAGGADVVFAGPAALAAGVGTAVARAAGAGAGGAGAGGASEVLALSLLPLGAPMPSLPPGVSDFAVEVPAYGDRFSPSLPAGAVAAAAGSAAAGAWGLGQGDRVLSVLPYADPYGLVAGLLAPLAADAGVVLVRHPDPASLPHRAEVERVTASAGVDLPGLTRLPALS